NSLRNSRSGHTSTRSWLGSPDRRVDCLLPFDICWKEGAGLPAPMPFRRRRADSSAATATDDQRNPVLWTSSPWKYALPWCSGYSAPPPLRGGHLPRTAHFLQHRNLMEDHPTGLQGRGKANCPHPPSCLFFPIVGTNAG